MAKLVVEITVVCLAVLASAMATAMAEESVPPLITSASGSFLGSYLQSRRGCPINTFRGIRYAKAPIGDLRFKNPVMVEQYTGVVNATDGGTICPQPVLDEFLYLVSEDCLNINIYSPKLPSKGSKLLPVMFFIHPGGFYAFSGRSDFWGPEHLLDHDVVVVTINYRLASLGFLSTGDEYAQGNYGYKDQVIALRWVQKNIAAFGGNPDDVTIMGYSAGSISVGLHMISPMTKGLFHKAISMSASPIAQWPIPRDQFYLAQKQASLLNCSTTSSKEIVECLKTKSYLEFGNSLLGFLEFGADLTLVWTEVVEPDYGQERFLVEDPIDSIKNGRFQDVPLIIGMTELEFSGIGYTLVYNDTWRNQLNEQWDTIAPIVFLLERNTSRSVSLSEALKEAYLQGQNLSRSDQSAATLGLMCGDADIAFGVHRIANLWVNHKKAPMYYYRFNYTGDQSWYRHPITNKTIGAVHHDDLLYLFNISNQFQSMGLDSPHSNYIDQATTIWTNFATYGDPNPRPGQTVVEGISWPPMKPDEKTYMQINNGEWYTDTNLIEDRVQVWEDLYPLDYD